jgi:hypothetical protein
VRSTSAIARGPFGADRVAVLGGGAVRSRTRFSRLDFAIRFFLEILGAVVEINFLDPHRSCQDVTFMDSDLWLLRE